MLSLHDSLPIFYVVSRRGNRAASVNTPLFETRYTTGGLDPACVFGGGVCPDLRPFQKTGKETVTDVEIGSKLSFRAGEARGLFNVSAFYSKYKNALQFLNRSEEHTSELQSLMRISYAVFCLQKKNN